MRFLSRFVLTLAIAGLVAGQSYAQPRFGGAMRGIMVNPAFLLRNTDVQKELKLTEEQIADYKKFSDGIQETMREKFQELIGLDEKERDAKIKELMTSISADCMKAVKLTADQSKRLKQIGLQAQGAEAYSDPEVQKALKLTDKQKEEIKTIQKDAQKDMEDMFRDLQGGDRQEIAKKMQEHQKATNQKVVAVLSEDQKKAWKKLVGAPFELKMQGFGGGRQRQ